MEKKLIRKFKKIRKLKVYQSGRDPELPVVVLQGQWLWDVGFRPGQNISVEIERPGFLIVKWDADPFAECLKLDYTYIINS